jgi:ATP adenylyltransferase
MMLNKGTLWESVVRTTKNALKTGALLPVPTDHVFVEDDGMRFFVRILAGLRRKDEAKKKQAAESAAGKNANPFLKPDKELMVADISATHLAILNKFNVVEHHLLLITREFENQDTLLTQQDFEALWLCMAEYNGLVFYNGGAAAGASQQHKHLQIVPLPLAPQGPAVPIAPLLESTRGQKLQTIAGFPFLHSFVRLDPDIVNSPLDAARSTFKLYAAMLRSVGMHAPQPGAPTLQSMPYCFLVTRDWLLLVPRAMEFFEDISLNSLAFAGSLFVRNEQQLEKLKNAGPMKALASVALPNNGPRR